MKYKVTHKTDYIYQLPVTLCYNTAYMLPGSNFYQTCFKRDLQITPEPCYYSERLDFFGNQMSFFCIQQPHQELSIAVSSDIEVHELTNLDLSLSVPWNEAQNLLKYSSDDNHINAKQFCFDSSLVKVSDEIYSYARHSFPEQRPLLLAVQDLMSRIYHDFEYSPNFTTVATPLSEVLAHRKGVCQDFAHLAIACIRAMGLPAQYVSGYIETLPPEGQPRIVGADASHAWFASFDPKLGWVEFDPTNNQKPNLQYIRTAYGRDYSDVTPLKGVLYGGGKHQLTVSVDVCPADNQNSNAFSQFQYQS
jgi:transglutaminase-like putative cysteine protease